jgi:hypothetical protein
LDSTFKKALASVFSSKQNGGGSNLINELGLEHVWGTTLGPATTTITTSADGAGDGDGGGGGGQMYHALLFANISDPNGYVVDVAELTEIEASALHGNKRPSSVSPSAAATVAPTAYVAREFYSHELRIVNSSNPLHVQHSGRPASCANGGYDNDYCSPFDLWTLAPLPVSGSRASWVLLGEVDKFVAISPQRFADITSTATTLSVSVTGEPGEVVHLGILDSKGYGSQADNLAWSTRMATSDVSCTIGSDGTATLKCGSSCSC